MTIILISILLVIWSIWGYLSSRVESAAYTIIKKTKEYEVRDYPPHIVAQTTVQGSYEEAMNAGFRIIANYIFGGNKKRESIAMTAPVIAQKKEKITSSENIAMTAPVVATKDGNAHTISFGMPRSYSLDTLPTPNDSRVKITTIPEKKYAVLRFSWYRSNKRIMRMQEKLQASLTRDKITTKGNMAYAGYNAPWTPPWMNRNEVMIEIV